MWVRRVRCHVCGGPKVTPSRTAHDHCSWCGAFTDCNHAVAYATRGSMLPGPHYDALRTYLQPQIEEARRRGHFPNLVAAYRQLYAAHVVDCPVLTAFMPLQERLDSLLRPVGALEVHPDAPPLTLLQKIGRSAFLQAWMPMLEHDTGLAALESTGLTDQYEELTEFVVQTHVCAECRAEVPTVEGARAVLCETCGTLGGSERVVRCGGCGGGFSPMRGAIEVACPYCQRVVDASALR